MLYCLATICRRAPLFAVCLLASQFVFSTSQAAEPLTLADLDLRVLPADVEVPWSEMVRTQQRARLQSANERSTSEWKQIASRAAWESFRDEKIAALKKSLGEFPTPPEKLHVREAGTIVGEGYKVRRLAYQTRPGLWVSAHLYVPRPLPKSMPGIIIAHSHHRPKEQRELQTMGETWARHGCLVLVPDHLGHGERRQHPFASQKDFDREFAESRQDYYFRFDAGIQLHLVGNSLMGWIVWDLMRGVDLLLDQPGIDPEKIILLGAVAGGGDPCAVATALDERIKCEVPFNFGGGGSPQRGNTKTNFNYAGSGSWESTRNLRRSAADGFLPWLLVGATAPRALIYAHEFEWRGELDPVWDRLEVIYGRYGVPQFLASTTGRGYVKLRPPEATHCTNIGAEHRTMIHPRFREWFGIDASSESEFSHEYSSAELKCFTPDVLAEIDYQKLPDLLPPMTSEQLSDARDRLAAFTPAAQRDHLRQAWAKRLGLPAEHKAVLAKGVAPGNQDLSQLANLKKYALETEPGITVPVVEFVPKGKPSGGVVVCVSQHGKQEFLQQNEAGIRELLQAGISVVVPDLRGIGETRPGSGRDRYSASTTHSSTELMLGGTMLGGRLHDLLCVLQQVQRTSKNQKVAIWGDSFAKSNPADTNFNVPRRIDGRPHDSEPAGALLALLAGLYDERISAIYAGGGLDGFASLLDSFVTHVPHDCIVPGIFTSGDVSDVAAALVPRPLCVQRVVNGLNVELSPQVLAQQYAPVRAAYEKQQVADRVVLGTETPAARWLVEALGLEETKR